MKNDEGTQAPAGDPGDDGGGVFTDAELVAIRDADRWIKVKKLVIPEDATAGERYRLLEAHHLAETRLVIATCRRLAASLLDLRESIR